MPRVETGIDMLRIKEIEERLVQITFEKNVAVLEQNKEKFDELTAEYAALKAELEELQNVK